MEREIKHFSHLHPLIQLEIEEMKFDSCHHCRRLIRGEAYHCKDCNLLFEGKCVEFGEVDHEHPLILDYRAYGKKPPACFGCYKPVSGTNYGCQGCNFFLHPSCAALPPVTNEHPAHPQHPLSLVFTPFDQTQLFNCSCCFWPLSGLSYYCEVCQSYLDIRCASDYEPLNHFVHESHPLFLRDVEESSCPNCSGCWKRFTTGRVYDCKLCEFSLHESCAQLPHEMQHPFHPQHPPLTLMNKGYMYIAMKFCCNACEKLRNGLIYQCSRCDFGIDVHCALLMPTLKHERHEHSLALFEAEAGVEFQCRVCFESRSNSPFYRCVVCNFNLHIECLVLPPTGKIDFHKHALTLHASLAEDDSKEEVNCDACEKPRNPKHGVYHCTVCNGFSAHIDCVVSSKGGQISSQPTADLNIGVLDQDIATLQAEADALATKLDALSYSSFGVHMQKPTQKSSAC